MGASEDDKRGTGWSGAQTSGWKGVDREAGGPGGQGGLEVRFLSRKPVPMVGKQCSLCVIKAGVKKKAGDAPGTEIPAPARRTHRGRSEAIRAIKMGGAHAQWCQRAGAGVGTHWKGWEEGGRGVESEPGVAAGSGGPETAIGALFSRSQRIPTLENRYRNGKEARGRALAHY